MSRKIAYLFPDTNESLDVELHVEEYLAYLQELPDTPVELRGVTPNSREAVVKKDLTLLPADLEQRPMRG